MSARSKFKVGMPAARGSNSDYQEVEKISHTSQVDNAFSILKPGEIRPSLVFDKSLLNDQGILISCLSPNDWTDGYISFCQMPGDRARSGHLR
jgi:hypothetical protein